MDKLSRGLTVKLDTARCTVRIVRTPEELQVLRDRDVANGRWCDDAGEPILYGVYGHVPREQGTITVTVTSMRPTWVGSYHRPKALCAGHCAELNREVLFQGPDAEEA